MKVLQIHNAYLEPGGEDGVVARERALLIGRGHAVLPIEFQNPDSARTQAQGLALSNWNPASSRRIKEVLEDESVDVTHVHNTWYTASPSAVSAAHRAAPVVATLHNYRRVCLNSYLYRDNAPCLDCVGRLPWKGVIRRCYRDSVGASVAIGLAASINRVARTLDRSIDRFLVLSDFAAELTEQSGVSADRITRHDNFVPDPGPRLSDVTESATVLAIGRLSPEKGFVELVEAWNRGGPEGLRLMVVGDGVERERLEALAGPSVDIVGRKSAEDVSSLMRTSRALLFPSRWFEGQPLVLLEALAAGLPIVSSDHPPLREIIEGGSQHICEDGDWVSALGITAEESWLRTASQAARVRYETRYTPDVAGDRLEEIYRSVRG